MADADYPVPDLSEASILLTLASPESGLGRAVLDSALEINRLRAENAALREADAYVQTNDRLRAENAALRQLGEQIIRLGMPCDSAGMDYYAALGDWDQVVKGDLHCDGYDLDYGGTRWEQARLLAPTPEDDR